MNCEAVRLDKAFALSLCGAYVAYNIWLWVPRMIALQSYRSHSYPAGRTFVPWDDIKKINAWAAGGAGASTTAAPAAAPADQQPRQRKSTRSQEVNSPTAPGLRRVLLQAQAVTSNAL